MFGTFIIIFGLLLVTAAISDIRHFKIPNWIPVTIGFLYVAATLLSTQTNLMNNPLAWMPSLAISASLFIAFTFLFALGHMGGGDVKLITATSLWAGPSLIIEFLLGMAIAGGILSGLFLIKNKFLKIQTPALTNQKSELSTKTIEQPMPYGVAIAAGGLLIMQRLLMAELG